MDPGSFELLNVAGTVVHPEGIIPQRVPEAVRVRLNSDGQEKALDVPNVEIRFVWDWDTPATVRLSSQAGAMAVAWYGDFQRILTQIGPEPVTIPLLPPAVFRGADLTKLPVRSFSPRVGRLMLHGGPVVIHEVSGEGMRRPRPEEVPGLRYAAYGSSIAHGVFASGPHLSYPSRIARAFGWDLLNLGFRGSALADRAMADYLADGLSWDVLTIEASANLVPFFTAREAALRWRYFLSRVVKAHPDKPIVILNMFLRHYDLPATRGSRDVEEYREVMREIVRELDAGNVTLLEGLLPEETGLTADLLHPGDDGFEWIARGVIAHLRDRLGFRPVLAAFRSGLA